MKKAIVTLVSILLFFSFMASIAYADSNNTYYLNTIDLTVTVPKGYIVFTRDIKANDPNLAKYGFTKDYLLSAMQAQQTYLEALSSDGLTEMYVAMIVDSGMNDFTMKSDETLKELIDVLLPQYYSMGIAMEKGEVYQHSQTKFIKFYATHVVNGITVYTRQYTTVHNGNTYNFTLQSYSGKISSSQEKDLQYFVDNASFGVDNTEVSSAEPSSSFLYTDQKTGLQFTVPAGWKEEPLYNTRKTIDAKFVSDTDIFAHIFYGSIDLWKTMPETDKYGLSRADISSSSLSKEEIEAILGTYNSGGTTITIQNVKTVTYNGIDYYYLESETSSNGITLPITQLIRIDNGYTYLFQYYGSRDSEYYTDFKNLLNSAAYVSAPVIEKTAAPTAKPKTKTTAKPIVTKNPNTDTSSQFLYYKRNAASTGTWTIIGIAILALIPGFIANKKGRSFAGYYFLSFLITPLVSIIITLCLKDRNKESERGSCSKQDVVPTVESTVTQSVEKNRMEGSEVFSDSPSTIEPAQPQVSDAPTTAERLSDEPIILVQGNDTNSDESELNRSVMLNEAVENDNLSAEPEQEDQSLLFCRYCGFKLLDNSEYCSHCGKKVR